MNVYIYVCMGVDMNVCMDECLYGYECACVNVNGVLYELCIDVYEYEYMIVCGWGMGVVGVCYARHILLSKNKFYGMSQNLILMECQPMFNKTNHKHTSSMVIVQTKPIYGIGMQTLQRNICICTCNKDIYEL